VRARSHTHTCVYTQYIGGFETGKESGRFASWINANTDHVNVEIVVKKQVLVWRGHNSRIADSNFIRVKNPKYYAHENNVFVEVLFCLRKHKRTCA